MKVCWNKSQQCRRAAVELWLVRHSVNRCATLCPLSLQIKLFEKYFYSRVCCDITKQCTDGSTVLRGFKLVCTCQSHHPTKNTQLYELSSLNTPAQRERLCSLHAYMLVTLVKRSNLLYYQSSTPCQASFHKIRYSFW